MRANRTIRALLLATFIVASGQPGLAHAQIVIKLRTDSSWTTLDAQGRVVGPAQPVCPNVASASGCPPNATVYGYPDALSEWNFQAWMDFSAAWIWAPGITGTTPNAAGAEFSFQRGFLSCDIPSWGSIWFGADDSAELFVNNHSLGTSPPQADVSHRSVPPWYIDRGLNVVKLKARNAGNPIDCPSGQYHCNPAGVVLAAEFKFQPGPPSQCIGETGATLALGETETLACPAGMVGSQSRLCLCDGMWSTVTSTCATPTPSCFGIGGAPFAVGTSESFGCPPGLNGLRTRTCVADQTWGPLFSTCIGPAFATCTGSGGISFAQGATETLACASPQVGSIVHTCQSDGSWGPTINTCRLPDVAAGAQCGSRDGGITGLCPSGTSCGPRLLPPPSRPLQCVIFGIDCPARLQTADWFCDP